MSPRSGLIHPTHLSLCQTCTMIPTEISRLDMAERGNSDGSLAKEASRQVDEIEAHRHSESMVQPQTCGIQDEGLG